MDPAHKTRLQKSWLPLLDNISDYDGITDGLFTAEIFTRALRDRVMEKKGRDKMREILDLLPKRGPKAFDAFYQVLVDCEEDIAADILCPERAEQRKANAARHHAPAGVQESQPAARLGDDDDELPKKWPDHNAHDPFRVEVVKVGATDQWMKNKFQNATAGKGNTYGMHKAQRGIFLLISNEFFKEARANGETLADRDGTGKDCHGLQELFKQLGFRPVVRMNQTADEMLETVLHHTTQVDPTDNCFCLAILTHGDRGMVYGTDGKKLSLDEVKAAVVDNCPSLLGKPKLFFIQACQGEKLDSGLTVQSGGYGEGGPDPQGKAEMDDVVKNLAGLNIKPKTHSDAAAETTASSKSDVFVAMATVPDFVSWRNTNWGTWFVQAVIYIFSHFAHKYEINGLMIRVNKLVSQGETTKGYKQVSVFHSSLTSEFYFFPGLQQQALVESHSEVDFTKGKNPQQPKQPQAPVQTATPQGTAASQPASLPQSAQSELLSLGSGVVAQPTDGVDGGPSYLV